MPLLGVFMGSFAQELILEESEGDSENEEDDFLRDSVDEEAVAASNALSSPETPDRSQGSMITKARKKVLLLKAGTDDGRYLFFFSLA